MTIRTGLLTFLSILSVVGCGGGGDPTGNGGGDDDAFTATIAGQAWASNAAPYIQLTAGSTPGSLIISGSQVENVSSIRSLSLILGRIEGPGSYSLGVDGGTIAGGSANLIITNGNTVTTWTTPLSGNAGSVTITSLTASRIAGNFSFEATPLPGQAGTNQSVTAGHFNLPLPSGFVAATGTSRGSTMSGTIGGTAWNPATITSVGSFQNGAFVFGGLNTAASPTTSAYQVLITPFPGVSQGVFPLSAGTTLRVNQVGSTNAWGSNGSTGSVTISSFNGFRVVGTFNAVLSPIGATVGNLTANGSFDINLNLTN